MKIEFKEGEDFYYNNNGLMVLTKNYLLRRGFCCGNGCLHCPYDYEKVAGPLRSKLQSIKKNEKIKN